MMAAPDRALLADIQRSAGLLWWLQWQIGQADPSPVLSAVYDCERQRLDDLCALAPDALTVARAEQTGRQLTQMLCEFANRLEP